MPGNPLILGDLCGLGQQVLLPAAARERHVYVCGGTGVGKSKFLEYCIRQDILNWRDSRCGLMLLDPHGLVYHNTLAWLARHNLKRPIVPIDLRRDDWVISYNLLRKRAGTDTAVIASDFVDALSHVWGDNSTDRTPLFARIAWAVLLTLYENDCTIADVMQLLSRHDLQRAMSAKITNPSARQVWQSAARRPKEFERDLTSTLNRFNRLVGAKIMQATFGQSDHSLDLSVALEEGHIILVNLSTEGGQVTEENTKTFATLLLTDLWTAAKTRGKREREAMRPFYVYADECQNFITPTIAKNLDQARGFGLHLTLANQFPSQILNEGSNGKGLYDSILANAGTKIVFRLEHPTDIKDLAAWLFMNTLNTDEAKLVLESTKVVGYSEEQRETYTASHSKATTATTSHGGGAFQAMSASLGVGGRANGDPKTWDIEDDDDVTLERWNAAFSEACGESANWKEGMAETEVEAESITQGTVFVPIMGKEVSSVQYRTIDEQLFRAMQRLFGQGDRQFAVRFPGGKAPVFVRTPDVVPAATRRERIEQYRRKLLGSLPYALPLAEAVKRLDARERKLLDTIVGDVESGEPTTAKRRIS
jgi:hypothetical protein